MVSEASFVDVMRIDGTCGNSWHFGGINFADEHLVRRSIKQQSASTNANISAKTWTRYFLIMHMLSYSLTSTFIGTEIAIYLQQLSIVTRITRTFVSITDLALSVLLFLLTALAIYAIVKYKGAKASVADPQRVMEQQRRRLISLVIYSGLPNLLNIPSIITAFFAIAQQFDAKISIMTTVDDIAEELDIYVHSFRTIVLSVCTLVAFAPYRTAMMRIFRRGANSTVKSMKMVIYNGSNQRQPTTMKPPSISIVQPAQLERR
ncbi:hypothetical protein Tcan_09937 [Toxocara canis]|uniref:G protein-coupled receptor n=1 Tax=Toxocara canis TaxID=6265 RepID=A0A0B2V5W7_TOXCA|nr:hypothetical protein Tcan_09937 [Toxocara canis]